jgi:uncharacterized SAM-binding protein YcdF (DUF218 family)
VNHALAPADCIIVLGSHDPRVAERGAEVFSRELLAARGIRPRKAIAVQKPYMERRTLATFHQRWPELEVIVTSPQIPFEAYPTDRISREDVVQIMVGDLQRLMLYAERGWSAPQEIPPQVMDAFDRLVQAGYTSRLVPV